MRFGPKKPRTGKKVWLIHQTRRYDFYARTFIGVASSRIQAERMMRKYIKDTSRCKKTHLQYSSDDSFTIWIN